jgi:thiamine-phosphate pyrophosphorylase
VNKAQVDYSLYLVTDRELLGDREFQQCIKAALAGGVSIVQLREKSVSTREFLELALQTKQVVAEYKVPLIINDRLDIALAVDADGLHVGQDDLPLEVAKRLLAPDKIIGVSVSTVEEALLAEQQGADYLGVGAMFPTSTKGDAKQVSLEQLRLIKQAVRIPVVAIGGINVSNVGQVMDYGIDGISVVSAILGQADIQGAAAELSCLIKK